MFVKDKDLDGYNSSISIERKTRRSEIIMPYSSQWRYSCNRPAIYVLSVPVWILLEMEAHAGEYLIKKRSMSFAFEKTSRLSLSCKLVPVLYRRLENGIFGIL